MGDFVEVKARTGQKTKAILHLHYGQRAAWDSTARFTFVISGTQGGKTVYGPWWLWREIRRKGPGDYLAVSATFDLFKLKMLPEMIRVFCGYLSGEGWEWRAGEKCITSDALGARIILRSANAEGGLESATAKAAWLDECGQNVFGLDAWEAVQRRLAIHEGRVLGTTTVYNLAWLKTEVYDRWRNGDPEYRVIQFPSIANPMFPQKEFDRAQATLASWKFAMFYRGEFDRPAGLIYEDFSDTENTVLPLEIPPVWPRRVGIDFGAVNNAMLWVAEDPETNVLYLYREDLEGNMTTAAHCEKALEAARSENVVCWTGGAKSEKQQRLDWCAEGVEVEEPHIADVEAGIDRVLALIKTRRLKVFRDCKGTLDELARYSRKLDDEGQITEEIVDKSAFHRLDALRYVASTMELGGWESFPKRGESGMKIGLWIIGRITRVYPDGTSGWELEGVFLTKRQARAVCTSPNHFIGRVPLGTVAPEATVPFPAFEMPLAKAE